MNKVAKWLVKYQNAGNLSAVAGAFVLYQFKSLGLGILCFSLLLVSFAFFCSIFGGFERIEKNKDTKKQGWSSSFKDSFLEWWRKNSNWKGIMYQLVLVFIAVFVVVVMGVALSPLHIHFAVLIASMSVGDMFLSHLGFRPEGY